MLNDISAVLSWEKINTGLLKMYKVRRHLQKVVRFCFYKSFWHLVHCTPGRMLRKVSNHATLPVRFNTHARGEWGRFFTSQ